MGEPASYGSIQRTTTSSRLQMVTGASGFSGLYAVIILIVSENSLLPMMFLAFTLNKWLTPGTIASSVNSVVLTDGATS